MPVKYKDMMRELFTPKERAAIRRTASGIAKRHMALRELRQARNRTQVSMAKRLGVKQVSISRLESRGSLPCRMGRPMANCRQSTIARL
jgi:Helix-turn-helix